MILSISLVETKQTYQVLPLLPPVMVILLINLSLQFAGNTHLIDFDLLTQMGLLERSWIMHQSILVMIN